MKYKYLLQEQKKYVRSIDNILVFNDEESFSKVLNLLEDIFKEYKCIYSDFYDEEDYVLEEFENILGYYSYRKYLSKRRTGLITTSDLYSDNDPNDCLYGDKILQFLANENFIFRIGNEIYNLNEKINSYNKPITNSDYFNNETKSNFDFEIEGINQQRQSGTISTTITIQSQIGLSVSFYAQTIASGNCSDTLYNQYIWSAFDSNNNPINIGVVNPTINPIITILFPRTGIYNVCVTAINTLGNCKSIISCTGWFNVSTSVISNCCKGWQVDVKETIYNNGQNMIKSRLYLYNLPLFGRIIASTINYEKRRNRFRLARASFISVQCSGKISKRTCNTGDIDITPAADGNFNRNRIRLRYYYPIPIFVKKDKLFSTHTVINPRTVQDTKKLAICL